MTNNAITLYVVPNCPLCAEARSWLKQHGIAYGERDVTADYSALRMMYRLTRQDLVPVLQVGEYVAVRPTEEQLVSMCEAQ